MNVYGFFFSAFIVVAAATPADAGFVCGFLGNVGFKNRNKINVHANQ